MVTATLWIEITIAGFVYLLGFCFLFLPPTPSVDLKAVLAYKDLLPYFSAALIGVSYIVGIVFHRVVVVIARFLTTHMRIGRLGERLGSYSSQRSAQLTEIWQFGSQRLQREIDFHFGLLALLRSLLTSVPLLAISSTVWATRSEIASPWRMSAAYVIFWALCFTAHYRQIGLYRKAQDAAVKVVEAVRNMQAQSKD